MFQNLHPFAGDPILGLSEAYARDNNPDKINLTVGVYCDTKGNVPILETVREAEQARLESGAKKTYLPMCGTASFGQLFADWVLGPEQHENVAASYTLGGTGGLRVLADLLVESGSKPNIWCSAPTWGNHISIFAEAGLNYQYYPYQYQQGVLNLDAIITSLRMAKAGDLVLLHGCCHNPTGIDPTSEQWLELFDFMHEKQLIPFFDVAYHGFAHSPEQDIWALRTAKTRFPLLLVAYSFSKIMGLYGERAGGILVCTDSSHQAQLVQGNLARLARCMYSTPAMHGAFIVEYLLSQADMKTRWLAELAGYQKRLSSIRSLFAKTLIQHKISWPDFAKTAGLFAMLPLTVTQAQCLRSEYGIYLLDNGRINVAGLNKNNVDTVAQALANIVK